MKNFLACALIAVLMAGAAFAQAKQPQPKSQKELEALQAIFAAATPDARIKASEKLITDFADTDFKGLAFEIITTSYEELNDFEKMMAYGEQALTADPQNYRVMFMMAKGLAQRTREHDFDKEEKLKRVESLVSNANRLLAAAAKPNPQVPDEQWEAAKKDYAAQGYEAQALANVVRKNWDAAYDQFKKAIETATNQDPATKIRYANALSLGGKHDEAIALMDTIINDPNLPPVYKQFAQRQKDDSIKQKSAK